MSTKYELLENRALELAKLMAVSGANSQHLSIQTIQTHHRLKLAHEWHLRPSSSVLEIGCGQGDTTVVLADIVGPTGHVTGVDIGPRDYGAPITIGDSTDHILNGPLGDRITFHLETDIMNNEDTTLFTQKFDYVVLSHCCWYFASPDYLIALLRRLRALARSLLFAEYQAYLPSDPAQYPHFASVVIQSQLEAKKASSTSNIRTLFTPDMIRGAVVEAGWTITHEFTVETPELGDGGWEVATVLHDNFGREINSLFREGRMSEQEVRLIKTQVEILRIATEKVKERGEKLQTLPTWGFSAE